MEWLARRTKRSLQEIHCSAVSRNSNAGRLDCDGLPRYSRVKQQCFESAGMGVDVEPVRYVESQEGIPSAASQPFGLGGGIWDGAPDTQASICKLDHYLKSA